MDYGVKGSDSNVAIVCGSDSPIGDALVERMQSAGMWVITVDNPDATPSPNASLSLQGDLGEEAAWKEVRAGIQAAGKLPRLFAYTSAESDAPTLPLDLRQDRWDFVFARNLRSMHLACRTLVPSIGAGGAVVLLSSVWGTLDTRAEAPARSASGAAVLSYVRSLAVSVASRGIRVNAVCVGLLAHPRDGLSAEARREATRRIPMGRLTEPADVVDAVMFLLSTDASYLNGSELVVDGGQSLQSWSNAPDAGYGPEAAGASRK